MNTNKPAKQLNHTSGKLSIDLVDETFELL